MKGPRKICVVTSYAAAAEPRGPRHAIAAKKAFPNADVVLVDLAPAGVPHLPEPALIFGQDIERRTLEFPSRASGIVKLAVRKLISRLGHGAFEHLGILSESIFGDRTQGLTRALYEMRADLYIAHNIETLLPAIRAAERHNAAIAFDCMEFYSDMGDSQHPIEAAAARVLEARYLQHCALVIASSDVMADALAAEYGIIQPLAAYNVPPKEQCLPSRQRGGLNLYWRNSVVGFGQRGLEDILDAMVMLPNEVRLSLQGRQTPETKSALDERLAKLGLSDRVCVLPPYAPHEAVLKAALHDVGLCLERRGPRNHDLTVSNKMFDYHMAGLAVIATDLPALADVVSRSGGGMICRPGDPQSLADSIQALLDAPERLAEMQDKARRFALREANLEMEIEKIAAALRQATNQREVAAQ
jgi:glycosyltransferase involved in cell wall biosynthesis